MTKHFGIVYDEHRYPVYVTFVLGDVLEQSLIDQNSGW